MKKLRTKFFPAAVLVMMVAFSVSGPVTAMQAESNGNDAAATQTTAQTKKAEAEARAAKLKAEQEQARERVQEAKNHAKSDDKSGRTDAQKQKICSARKNSINAHTKQLVTSSQSAQKRINTILAKAQKYQAAKNIQISNYTEFLTAATSAQATSKASIDSLAASAPTIDCGNGQAASQVAAFKAAATQTRTNLKAYRSSVKALLQALHQASPKNKGGQQ